MNFKTEFIKGQEGGNKGLPMGPGLGNVSKAINGIQQGRQFVIASAPKVGKSTVVNYAFVIQPFLYALDNPEIEVEWVYYSLEMNRVSQEFDFAAYFLFHDHKITEEILPPGVTLNGKNIVPLSSNYLRGRVQDDNGDLIKVSEKVKECLINVYEKRIKILFGEYSEYGIQLKKGYITFIKNADNPRGIYLSLVKLAEANGTVLYEGDKYKRMVGYRAKNPNKFTIIITDHMRKLIPESGFKMKQTVDKMSEYHGILRDTFNFTFVDIIHLNRSVSDVQRMKAFGDMLFPSSDDIKDFF